MCISKIFEYNTTSKLTSRGPSKEAFLAKNIYLYLKKWIYALIMILNSKTYKCDLKWKNSYNYIPWLARTYYQLLIGLERNTGFRYFMMGGWMIHNSPHFFHFFWNAISSPQNVCLFPHMLDLKRLVIYFHLSGWSVHKIVSQKSKYDNDSQTSEEFIDFQHTTAFFLYFNLFSFFLSLFLSSSSF